MTIAVDWDINHHNQTKIKVLTIIHMTSENMTIILIILMEFLRDTEKKTCVKRPLKYRQNKYLNDKW